SSNRTGAIGNSYVLADASESFQGYDEPSSIRGRIDYRTYYHTNNGNNSATLLKPLIIIDGFDPQNKRRIEDVDCANDPSCVSLYNGQFSYANHRSIFDLMQPTDGSPNLVGRLRDIGYDVIIVNHPTYVSGGRTIDGGADFIERNGLALTRLIRNLNTTVANNGSNEELVIVGPSMGGQISRYALSYMEKKYQETNQAQWLHNTRLWISVDSPHLGANIPLGVQAFINQAKDDSDSAQDFADNQLGSPAAKQQLIEQYNGTSSSHLNARTVSQGYSYSRGSTFFQQFYNNLFNNGLAGSKGYPQNLRKIALVNGSLTGSKAYENPFTNNANDSYANHSEQTVNMRAFQRINIIPFTNFTEHIASIETYFLPNTSSYGKISRFKKSFNDASVYMTNSNSRGNMDNVSGGWFPAQYDLAKPTIGTNPTNASGSFWASFEDALANVVEGISGLLGGSYWSLRTLKHSSSFIASFSAIGHTSPDRSWAQALDKNLVCQNLTPFDSYFGHDKNTQHTSFNAESVVWLLAELGGNQLDPYFPVAQSALVGPNPMCSAGQAVTYAFQSCSAPGDVQTWSVSNNLTVVSSNGNAITVIAAANYKGNGWINASFNNGVVVQKEIWIGKPNIYVDFENDPDLYNWANFSIEGVGGTDVMNQEITSIDWTELSTVGYANLLVSDGDYEGSGHGSGNTWRIEAKVDVTNACGTTTKYMTITPPPPGNNPCRQMVSYKVKTISKAVYYINKVIEDPCKQGSAKESESNDRFETFVYDFTGNLVFKTTSRTIDLTKHKPGMYVLKVFVNNELISTKKVAKS
ncbi:MAG: hypothetical protein KBT69_01710, partial [Oceanihabitans sp.]|nr:hypothetical protein [Oceanihabitans sp.]